MGALFSRAPAGQRQDQGGNNLQGSLGRSDVTVGITRRKDGLQGVSSQTLCTARPHVLPQSAVAVGGAVPHPPHSACAENRTSNIVRCSRRGMAAFLLPTRRQKVLSNSSALPVPIAFPFVPLVISSFLSKTDKVCMRWVATSYSAVRAAFTKLCCQFLWCRGGSGRVLQVPWHPWTCVEMCAGPGSHSCTTSQGWTAAQY